MTRMPKKCARNLMHFLPRSRHECTARKVRGGSVAVSHRSNGQVAAMKEASARLSLNGSSSCGAKPEISG